MKGRVGVQMMTLFATLMMIVVRGSTAEIQSIGPLNLNVQDRKVIMRHAQMTTSA